MDIPKMRKQFPITDNYGYFNHAAVSPLPLCTAEAMNSQLARVMSHGVHGVPHWQEDYQGLRDATAAMIHSAASEIAITKNTSEGLAAIANGIDWKQGDVIVGLEDDFPANYLPWRELQERHGVHFRSLSLRNGLLDLNELDSACNGARIAALSYVHYITGFRWDLDAVGEICERRGCRLVLDAVQGLGVFPVNVKHSKIHALSASGHKWLLGPEGCAILYVDSNWVNELKPMEFGWTNIEGFETQRTDGKVRPDAGRFECGTLNSVGCAGLRTSMEFLNKIGQEESTCIIHSLSEYLRMRTSEKGYSTAAWGKRVNCSGITAIRKDGVDSGSVVEMLFQNHFSTSHRRGFIRIAPHIYNTTEEIDQLIELLP